MDEFDADEAHKARHKKGDKVKIKHTGPRTKHGQSGTVKSQHYGVYYQVSTNNGVAYVPQTHVDPAPTPPPDPAPPGGQAAPATTMTEAEFLDEIVHLL